MSGIVPQMYILAGPNGAGKTTYAFAHIAQVAGSTEFVNLDEIARGVSPLDPEKAKQRAARVALGMTHDLISQRKTFTIETTLAGKTHLRTLASARAAGFKIVLLYFAPKNVEICLTRIARRVSEGGHDVPEADVRRRFQRSSINLAAYAASADIWRVFDVTNTKIRVAAEGRVQCVASRFSEALNSPEVENWIASLPDCSEAS